MRKVVFIFFILLSACSITKKSNTFLVLSVDHTGTDGANSAFCSDFKLEKTQVQEFFERATRISIKELHDGYSYLPCYVQGKAKLNNKDCVWEIRAGGTGEITCGEDVFMYGCMNCDDLLR